MAPFLPTGATPTITGFSHTCSHITAACRTDGSGSQMQAKISAWAYAQLTGLKYVHVPISRLDHFNDDQQAQVTKSLEDFFNLGEDEVPLQQAVKEQASMCSVLACFSFFDHGGIDCWERVKPQLLRKYRGTAKPPTYFLHDDPTATMPPRTRTLTVAMHIRRGDVNVHKATDGDRFNSNDYYVDVLRRLRQALPSFVQRRVLLDIAVISEGVPTDFASILEAFPSTRLYLGTDLLRSLHTLISADVMVMARSSLSYVAATYNEGVVVYNSYWHKQQLSWVLNDADNSTILTSALSDPNIHNLLVNRVKSRRARLKVSQAGT